MYTLKELKEILGDDYRFHQHKTVEEMKEILEMGERPTDDVPVILEVGNLDLEITVYGNGTENDPLFWGYYCCVRNEGMWSSYDDLPDEVNLDVADIESEMFKILDRFAEEHGLSFFTQNEQLPQNESYQECEGEMER